MRLNYRQQNNGMFILGRNEIELIATGVLREFAPQNLNSPMALNISALFEYFGLVEKHVFLGIPGREFLGVTVMGDSAEIPVCDILMNPDVIEETYGTVLIHSELCCAQQAPRRRYTEAHECSHWILHKPYYDQLPTSRSGRLVACRSVETYKRAKRTDADWREWQADTLAAALLMPREVFCEYTQYLLKRAGAPWGYLIEGQASSRAIFREVICPVSDQFSVSHRAAQIRMIHLGLIRTPSNN
ncbi:MAG: ImmA/IrrE family metallo-endopeptidase [Oscillospiraceae bacterium]|nr:ImmA/IrrE family metallo-endopeptidase [Oscillospiraceae bacterium]